MTADLVAAEERLDGRWSLVFRLPDGTFPTVILDRTEVERAAADPTVAAALLARASRR